MTIPNHLKVYREPLSSSAPIDTYVFQVSALCQMHWDYVFECLNGETPQIWIRSYRCFQRDSYDSEWRVVDQLPFDIPMWENMLIGISQHIGHQLFATAKFVGDLCEMPRDFADGAAEAAQKQYPLGEFRKLMLRSGSTPSK